MPSIIVVMFDALLVGAALISCFRFGRISSELYPFIFLIWISVIQAFLFPQFLTPDLSGMQSASPLALVDVLLVSWQFSKWKGTGSRKRSAVIALLVASYVALYVLRTTIPGSVLFFWITVSLLAVFASINQVTAILLRPGAAFLKTPRFVISLTFVLYFTCIAITCVLQLYGLAPVGPISRQWHILFGSIQLFAGLSGCWILLAAPPKKVILL